MLLCEVDANLRLLGVVFVLLGLFGSSICLSSSSANRTIGDRERELLFTRDLLHGFDGVGEALSDDMEKLERLLVHEANLAFAAVSVVLVADADVFVFVASLLSRNSGISRFLKSIKPRWSSRR